MSIVVKARIRLLFEINLVDLRTDPFKKEGMMMETVQPQRTI